MKEKAESVLKLIEQGHETVEIQTELGLSNVELNRILKYIRDVGYNLGRNFNSDGEMRYVLSHSITSQDKKHFRINVEGRRLRAIFISDLHIGSKGESPKLYKQVIDYALNTGCHIIFNGGDVIDNIYVDAPFPPKIPTVRQQISHYLRITPFHPHLIYFNLYGNHDYKSLQEKGLDVARLIESRRYDIPSLGYGDCRIHLKDDIIAITHDLKKVSKNEIPENVSAVYRGHSHKSKTRDNKIIYIPCLSEVIINAYEYRPLVGFLDCEFLFYNKKIARINMKQLAIVQSEIRLANEETMIIQPEFQDNTRRLTKNNKGS